MGTGGAFIRSRVKQLAGETDRSSPPIAEFVNSWSCISTPLSLYDVRHITHRNNFIFTLRNSQVPLTLKQNMLINFLGYLTLKMVAQQTFNTSENFYPTTKYNIPEELDLLFIKSSTKNVEK